MPLVLVVTGARWLLARRYLPDARLVDRGPACQESLSHCVRLVARASAWRDNFALTDREERNRNAPAVTVFCFRGHAVTVMHAKKILFDFNVNVKWMYSDSNFSVFLYLILNSYSIKM